MASMGLGAISPLLTVKTAPLPTGGVPSLDGRRHELDGGVAQQRGADLHVIVRVEQATGVDVGLQRDVVLQIFDGGDAADE